MGALLAAAALVSTSVAAAAGDPATELAQRYAPVVRLVEQPKPCGHGEPFEPIDVNAVLGNADVALRGPWGGANIVEVAPTARDLAKGRFGYNLDFPGNALAPGCTYDRWSRRLLSTWRPTVYAHVVTEPAHPGELALQYWLFYVFNDFNDKHEGDWEMIQLDFRARTAAEALAVKPDEVGYSQHEGAERARFGDEKLELVDGTHPVVYPALGSHANYYEPKLYLGRSAAQGIGCDETTGPSREVRPAVEVVPTGRAAALRRFPWLGYVGRWGESHRGFYNGPTGPSTKAQWRAPITWADTRWRDRSYTVPAGGSLGIAATDVFCGAVAGASGVLTALVGDPSPVLFSLAAIVALALWLASRTRWDESSPFRLRRRRPWGSLVTSALRMYGEKPRLFLGIGLLFVPLGLVDTGVQYLLFRHGTFAPLVASAGSSNAAVAILAFVVDAFFTVLGLSVVQAATAIAMVELDEGREVSAWTAYRLALRRLRPFVRPLVVAVVLVAVLSLTVVGAVVGFWFVVRWSLLAQVVVLDDETSPGPLRRSARLVRGHWSRVASVTVFVTGIALLLGPLVGTILLFVTSASFDFVNLVSGLVYVVALPFAAITTTYLYFDLTVRRRLEARERPGSDALPAEA
jgi:Vacuolar protein sorting-associated protein 62